MSITVLNNQFEGFYTNTRNLKNQSGVYLIVDCGNRGNFLLDVGESQNVKHRVENHDRQTCWSSNCSQTLKVAVLYTYEANRMKIEKQIRAQYKPTCGVF